jgi:hypothetical protein
MIARCAVALALAVAATPMRALESERLYLSGEGPGDAVPWTFEVSAGRRAGFPSTLPVPSQWELHGFGTYRYGMDDPGTDEEGRYRVRFTPPASWRGRRVWLVFEGCMTDCTVAIDGETLLPVHRGGFTRFRYDVTTRVRPGVESRLDVRVEEASAEPTVEAAERTADYWLFGGIFRPVYLDASPTPGIDRVRVDARHDGRLAVAVELDVAAAGVLAGEVRERASGAVVHRFSAAVEGGRAAVSERVAGVRPWSAEDPALYELRLSFEAPASSSHQRTEVFGFRTFEVVAGQGLLVNGRRVLLKGVNRHSFWPTTGRALDAAVNRRDVELIRALNANAVRTSHYPPDAAFLRACDQLGLYVIDELPGWHDAYADDVGRVLARELVDRDHNHPSVIAWANGNEGGWNPDLDGELRRHDLQGRPVLHPDGVFAGVDAVHYPTWDELRRRLDPAAWSGRLRRLGRPAPIVLSTEALHGLYDGGHGAGLEDYWDLVRGSPLAGGLFLWSFLDEGVVRSDRGGALDTFSNYGADGIVGPFREPEGSFWAVRDLWSPIAILERDFDPAAREVRLTVENRYDLVDLGGTRLWWEWLRLPAPGGRAERMLARASTATPAIGPGLRAGVTLATPAEPADALRVRALDRSGSEVAVFVLPAQAARTARTARPSAPRANGGAAIDGSAPLRLTAGDAVAEIDPTRGRLLSLGRAGRAVAFTGGPRAVGGGEPRLLAARRRQDADGDHVSLRYDGAMPELELTLEPSGWLRADWVLVVGEPSVLAGVELGLDEEGVRQLRWLGEGPFRVWGNRRAGGKLGVWSVERADTATGVDWRHPELGGFYAGVRWATVEMATGDLTIALEDPGLHLAVLRPRFPDGVGPDGEELARHARAPSPAGSLAVLRQIPGIGNKFHTAEETGPQGAARLAPGRYTGTFRLRVEPVE